MQTRVLLAFCLLGALASVHGWGWEGHQIVGKIAQGLLNDNAAAKVKDILENDQCGPSAPCQYGADLAGCAGWADEVKNEEPWKWTRAVHYVDSPDSKDLDSCSYEYDRDCYDHTYVVGAKGRCVTGGINNHTSRLQGMLDNLNASTSAACDLKFLIHYVGDVHQPLHVGFTSDRGGNLEFVSWYGKTEAKGFPYVLHALWDYDIIEKHQSEAYPQAGTKAWENYAADLSGNITKAQISQWSCTGDAPKCVDSWAVESITDACSNSYREADGTDIAFVNGSKLADPYFHNNIGMVSQRLSQGGVRLADILNRLWPADEAVLY
mmetsp:Transcript_54310/g.128259  ORF Transcript_54310/g.128259 Transcript_54310/m.128259 type:complete len:322 (-) Transcript_54310:1177-2142(-)